MPRLLVFQHVAFEILGTLNPLLKKSGFRIRYVNFERDPDAVPNVDGYHGLVVLGGPMNVDQVEAHPHLAAEVSAIRQAIEGDIPVLGICLGAQLIARALGAPVTVNPEKEIGWYDVAVSDAGREDPLFAHFADTEKIFQWHGDTFAIPAGATHLASTPSCRHQAFRHGDKVYGFQFHMEVDEPLIERWLTVPVHQEEIRASDGRIEPDRIRAETDTHIRSLKRLARRTFEGFIRLFEDA
ncbi:MAG: gamma-glutamyl-gamma-aminobutyrate hydrolase family protein [Myxococcales bacterium]|nr:gamma-glutamyl-gamma-aminobutyrate hydrolase family protein [Myxococcales bacterium]